MDLFSTREMAIATWILVVLICVFSITNTRRSFLSILDSLKEWKIVVSLSPVLLYSIGIVYLYRTAGFAYDRLWIDAGLWCFYGFYLVVRYVTKRDHTHVLRNAITENMTGIVFLELIIHTYTFSYLIELVLIASIVFIGMLDTVAGSRTEYKQVKRFVGSLLALVGLALAVYALVSVYNNPAVIRNVQTLTEVTLPVVMVLGFSPYLYLLLIVSHYEQIFVRLELGIEKPASFKRRAKWEVFKSLRLNYRKLNVFLGARSSALMCTTSLSEIRALLDHANHV